MKGEDTKRGLRLEELLVVHCMGIPPKHCRFHDKSKDEEFLTVTVIHKAFNHKFPLNKMRLHQTRSKFNFYAIKLAVLCIAVFILQYLIPKFTELFLLNQDSYVQLWRFVTAIFLHGGLAHLTLNMFALMFFGSILERFIGGKKFLIVFFATGIFANIIAVQFYNSSLGASGAIYGIFGALIFIRPLMTVWTFNLPMPMFLAGIVWIIANLLGTYGFLTGNPLDNTGTIAHLSGMILGFYFGFKYRKKIKRQRKRNVSLDEKEVRLWEDRYLRN